MAWFSYPLSGFLRCILSNANLRSTEACILFVIRCDSFSQDVLHEQELNHECYYVSLRNQFKDASFLETYLLRLQCWSSRWTTMTKQEMSRWRLTQLMIQSASGTWFARVMQGIDIDIKNDIAGITRTVSMMERQSGELSGTSWKYKLLELERKGKQNEKTTPRREQRNIQTNVSRTTVFRRYCVGPLATAISIVGDESLVEFPLNSNATSTDSPDLKFNDLSTTDGWYATLSYNVFKGLQKVMQSKHKCNNSLIFNTQVNTIMLKATHNYLESTIDKSQKKQFKWPLICKSLCF